MAYELQFKSSAWRTIQKLDRSARGRIVEVIMGLSENPRPRQAVKLSGKGGYYRLRTGDYRVIYEVQDRALVVLIVRVGHRRDIYRKL